MNQPSKKIGNATEKCYNILEENGGILANKSKSILLNDPTLEELKDPLQFISKNWRDPLTPSIMALSCEAVRGKPKKTYDSALAISLINLSFFLWDDIIDQAPSKAFQPTVSGKYGTGPALIIGGMASAKAFSILNDLNLEKTKKEKISNLIWHLLAVMAKVEMRTLKKRNSETYSSQIKLWKIKTESIDPETCMKIGAIIGNGSEFEITSLGKYGSNLGEILGIINDFRVSTNLTLELANKIKQKTLPYSLLLAIERSKFLKKNLEILLEQNKIDSKSIQMVVREMLETRVLEDIEKKVDICVQRAKEALNGLKQNKATFVLQEFIELQPRFFVESIQLLAELE